MDLIKNDIVEWGLEYLSSHGYTLKSNQSENVQIRPWSYVIRYDTSAGWIYLKQTPKLIALEATITKILHDQFHAPVPEIIASNSELDCFLMQNAGSPLRQILKKQFDVTLLLKSVIQFTALQLSVADHVDIFLKIGVPDWRLDKLPNLYEKLLSQKEVLIADGLLEKEIDQLILLMPTISTLCQKLSSYSIKPSLVQCDFHDNNILIDNTLQKITFIDLGEVVISHPFFSLVGFLWQVKKHHKLTETDYTYQILFDACFKNYFVSQKQLFDALNTTRILWHVYEALAQDRLRLACDKTEFEALQRHGKLADRLK